MRAKYYAGGHTTLVVVVYSLLEFRTVLAQVNLEDSPPFSCALSRDMLPHSPHRLREVNFCVSVLGFSPARTPPPLVGEVECHQEIKRGKPRNHPD
jgi:hypothetical protein